MKHIAILILMLATVYVAAEVPTNGLIAAYTFNGTNPWRDVSGHGHDLKPVDPAFAPEVVHDPRHNPQYQDFRKSVVYFKPNDRRISALSATISNLPKGEESRTIIFYLCLPSEEGYGGTVFSYGTTQNVLSILDTNKRGSLLYLLTFSYYLKGYPSTGFSNYTSQRDYIAENGGATVWTLVYIEYNSVTGFAIINVGGLGGSKSLTCPNPEAIGPLLIGGGSRGFTGYIDDIYIYNRVLTSNERDTIRLGNGTLNIPTRISKTEIHPIQMKPILNKTMYTVSGRKAQQAKGIIVNNGNTKVFVHQ